MTVHVEVVKSIKNVVEDNFGLTKMLNIQEYRSSMECMTSNIEELRDSL